MARVIFYFGIFFKPRVRNCDKRVKASAHFVFKKYPEVGTVILTALQTTSGACPKVQLAGQSHTTGSRATVGTHAAEMQMPPS